MDDSTVNLSMKETSTESSWLVQANGTEAFHFTEEYLHQIRMQIIFARFSVCVLLSISFASIILNTLILLTLKHWKKLGRPSSVLLKNITYADIVSAASVIMSAVFFFTGASTLYSCLITSALMVWAAMVSVSLILLMSVQNCINAWYLTKMNWIIVLLLKCIRLFD